MTLTEGEKHDLSKHDAVAFEAAEAEAEAGGAAQGQDDDNEPTCLAEDSFPVRRIVTPTSFTIPRTPALGAAAFRGGRFRQVKKPQTLAFQPMAQAREELLSLPTDFGKASLTHQLTLHACFETLERFRREKGRGPTPGSAKDARAFGKMVKACSLLQSVPQAHHAATTSKKKQARGPEAVAVNERWPRSLPAPARARWPPSAPWWAGRRRRRCSRPARAHLSP